MHVAVGLKRLAAIAATVAIVSAACGTTPATTASPPAATAAPTSAPASATAAPTSAPPSATAAATAAPATATAAPTAAASSAAPATASPSASATAAAGGTLTAHLYQPFHTFAPWDTSGTGGDLVVESLVWDMLAIYDEKGEVSYRLADSITPNADATEWTVKLKSGVQWSDGTPFTAKDVLFSWKINANPDQSPNSALWDGIVGIDAWRKGGDYSKDIAGLTAPDDTTVVFKLTEPRRRVPLHAAELPQHGPAERSDDARQAVGRRRVQARHEGPLRAAVLAVAAGRDRPLQVGQDRGRPVPPVRAQ